MKELLQKIVDSNALSKEEAACFLRIVANGEATPSQIGSFLTALRMKGETTEEIVGFVEGMRAHMSMLNAPNAFDIVGTGGDKSGSFNISTTSSFILAGAGLKVAKHGNRAASSKSGSADVLEALGVRIDLAPTEAEKVFSDTGFVFMMAPVYHPALKPVAVVRKELGFRTVFNILGPFANPARTKRQLTGVATAAIARKMAEASLQLGYERNMIVTSEDGLDEISIAAKTKVFDVYDGEIHEYEIDPKKYRLDGKYEDLKGGDAAENAGIVRSVLDGEKGAKRNVCVLNAGYALVAAGMVTTPEEGIRKAEESIDSGRANVVLQDYVAKSNTLM